MNPEQGDWLYFVTVNLSTGETKFTTGSVEEQNAQFRAVRQGIQGQQQERELKQRRRDDRDHRRADDRGCERNLARMVGSALGLEP